MRNTLVAIFGGLVFLLLLWSYLDAYADLVRSTQDKSVEHLTIEYRALSQYQAELADQVFEDKINQPEVLRLMAAASRTEDPERLADLRAELLDRLGPLYERMRDKGFRQLHFHLPGAISFLRFHRPEKFGDDLWKVRTGIARVNTERVPVSGFEEGRVFNGFRYIFPLYFEGEFVGSVETSYSFRSFLLSHGDRHLGAYRLLVSRDLVVRKVWDDERRHNYMDSVMHPGFVIDWHADLTQLTDVLPMARNWSQSRLAEIGEAVGPRVRRRMNDWQTFSVATRQPEPAVVSFLPIETTTGLKGAYLLRYAAAPQLAEAWSWLWIKVGLTAMLVLLTIGSMIYMNLRESSRAGEREHWLRMLNEAQRIARVGSWRFDVGSNRLSWSDEVYRIFGQEPGSLTPTYERFMEMVHPDDRERVEQAVEGSLQTGNTYQIDHRIVLPDTEIRYVHERGTVERDGSGRPTRMVGTTQDITDRIIASEESRQAATILRTTHEGVVIADESGRILSANPAVEHLLGNDQSELLGRFVDELVFDRDDTTPFNQVREVLRAAGSWEGELWLRRFGDGTNFFPTLASFTSITSDLGDRRFVVMFSDISEAKAREWAMWHKAHHDALTGLANRSLFHERLERALSSSERHGERVGVLYVDLNDFKPINDTYGHDVGDRLLVELARRMETVTRDEDTVSRQGGDEFAVLVARPVNPEAVERVAEKIHEAIESPVQLDELTLNPSASVGLAVYPDSGTTVEELLAAADDSMYRQKQAHKART
ncbi:diguanylate cyclase [Guyparkeria hydrothermalis]|uniref:diguanylate cyclase domain-containing protein n=1 Tax=Guyparkeria hydrothermalis TaxID=923 RepID=UPI0020218CB5|nr:diguanylate cyclase [Guyparkeria hydrothermalis]MCL7744103.1 diguanylate cyclase [Guyparkeria hydrothermalis]